MTAKKCVFVTYEEIDADHDTEENPEPTRRGYVDSDGFDVEIPEGLYGPDFTSWRDENVDPSEVEAVDDAVAFIRGGGYFEPNETGPLACPDSYRNEESVDTYSGVSRIQTVHLHGFTAEELRAIYKRVRS